MMSVTEFVRHFEIIRICRNEERIRFASYEGFHELRAHLGGQPQREAIDGKIEREGARMEAVRRRRGVWGLERSKSLPRRRGVWG